MPDDLLVKTIDNMHVELRESRKEFHDEVVRVHERIAEHEKRCEDERGIDRARFGRIEKKLIYGAALLVLLIASDHGMAVKLFGFLIP